MAPIASLVKSDTYIWTPFGLYSDDLCGYGPYCYAYVFMAYTVMAANLLGVHEDGRALALVETSSLDAMLERKLLQINLGVPVRLDVTVNYIGHDHKGHNYIGHHYTAITV